MRPIPLLVLALAALSPCQESALAPRLRALEQRLERLAGDAERLGSVHARFAAHRMHAALVASSPFADLRWQFLGPTNISGRVTDVAVATPRGRTYAMYVATASGGLWKTDNEGTTWTPVFEQMPTASIGDVTIAPSDPDTVWVGTGEANILRSSMAGCGVYKSTDGGASWRHAGLAATHTIARIVVHPRDADTVWVAASGREWTANPERGVYKTTDGGRTWKRLLFVDERTGAIDLVMDPSDPDTLWAATWERIRKRWNDPRNTEHHAGSGVWKSTDGGATWRAANDGLPAARHRGRIGIDVCRARPRVVYAFVDNYEPAPDELLDEDARGTDAYGRERQRPIKGAEVYRSDDGGGRWRKVSADDRYMLRLSATYGWVFGQIRVDPTDPDVVYVMGLALNVSRDGGKTFERLRGMHGDHHALWIDPDNPRYLVNGNDGGVNVSYDGGATWRLFADSLPAVQFYNVGYDMAEPFRVYGSIQDHGSRRAIVDLRLGRDAIPAQAWERAPGGEASYHAVDPTAADVVYSAGFYGAITRTHLRDDERTRIAPQAADGEPPLRGQWLAPFVLSPHNPRIVYHGMNFLFRSLDRGERFERISPDLTGDDPARSGDIPFQTITTIAESPLRFGLLYAGTDDGRLHMTRDSGAAWREIHAGLADDRWISRVEASRFAEGTVFVAQNGKRHDDFAAYLWRSRDFGATWTSIAGGLPGGPINVVREDPVQPGLLWVGTDLGVYLSADEGETWHALANGLPVTYVHDLIVHPRDDIAVIATHGRGMYALDARAARALSRPLAVDLDQLVDDAVLEVAREPAGIR
jgi:photosystem II stability/assembly factor-like uncharacterized protein